ncbi:hypothetical protein HYY73_06695 [Candidatus Woesearchaeota archaeon]|nr:hypothetical protein [Candidatus Woesearchaeota archaeon]
MGSLDDLFPGTVEIWSSESPLGGFGYEIGKNKHVYVDIDDGRDGFSVEVQELVTGLTAKPSARIRNLRTRQRERAVWATVAPIDDYNTIADAVSALAAKLRENYFTRYADTLEGPLEEAITAALAYLRVQPHGEA